MWWNVAIPIATALMQASAAKNKRNQQERQNIAESETTRYSPWTGQTGKPNYSYNASEGEALVGGGIQGLGIAQGLQGMDFGGGESEKLAGLSLGDTQASSPYSLGYGIKDKYSAAYQQPQGLSFNPYAKR